MILSNGREKVPAFIGGDVLPVDPTPQTKLTQMQVDMLLASCRGEPFNPTEEDIRLLYFEDITTY